MSPNDTGRVVRETPGGDANSGGPRLSVVLPHTEVALTEVAMREAARLARGLDAHVTVLAVRVVPFPEVLDPTRGCPGFEELLAMAETAGLPVTINIVYARDWESACQEAVQHGSLVVIAVRKGWLRSREERLAEWLVRAGYKVTTVPA